MLEWLVSIYVVEFAYKQTLPSTFGVASILDEDQATSNEDEIHTRANEAPQVSATTTLRVKDVDETHKEVAAGSQT